MSPHLGKKLNINSNAYFEMTELRIMPLAPRAYNISASWSGACPLDCSGRDFGDPPITSSLCIYSNYKYLTKLTGQWKSSINLVLRLSCKINCFFGELITAAVKEGYASWKSPNRIPGRVNILGACRILLIKIFYVRQLLNFINHPLRVCVFSAVTLLVP
jgi:hypothetical protein